MSTRAHDVLKVPGQPLAPATRAFFEPRFSRIAGLVPARDSSSVAVLAHSTTGQRGEEYEQQAETVAGQITSARDFNISTEGPLVDFSRVRVHTDPVAADAAHALNAHAFTVGSHIVFGQGEYDPQTSSSQKLIAHELTHVLQQSLGSAPTLQLACRAPEGFDFTNSTIADRIRAGLAAITVPSRTPGGAPTPRVDPDAILRILESSNCFLQDALTIERTYFARRGPTGGRAPLVLNFHEDPDIGSQFVRESSEHRVDMQVERGVTTTTPQALVRRIVHEIVHATHGATTTQPRRGAGSVTIAEEAGVREESQTRTRENEIMADIAAAQGWTDTPTPASPENVRGSFRSGLPKLTYQEYFIIEEMKQRNRVSGLDEARVVTEARSMAATGGVENVSAGSTSVFTFDSGTVTRHQGTAAAAPVAPLGIDEALECARLGQSSRPPANRSAGCNELLRILRGAGPLPYEPVNRHLRMLEILTQWQTRHAEQTASYQASSTFTGWYNGLPQAIKNNARTLRFFQWTLIAESMSREWQRLNRMDAETRRRHFEFLRAMIGTGPLRGISEPP